MTYAVVAVAMAALVWAVYAIVFQFNQAFGEAEKHKNEIIKEISEDHNDHPTPQQLTDFFSRPHP
jgi:hypothetical protein